MTDLLGFSGSTRDLNLPLFGGAVGSGKGEAFAAGFGVTDEIERGHEDKGGIDQLTAQANDVLTGEVEQDVVPFQFSECFVQSINCVTVAGVVLEKAAVAFDGAVTHFKGGGEAGEGVFESELLVQPAG